LNTTIDEENADGQGEDGSCVDDEEDVDVQDPRPPIRGHDQITFFSRFELFYSFSRQCPLRRMCFLDELITKNGPWCALMYIVYHRNG